MLSLVLEADTRLAYALVFGSTAREAIHAHSDVDVAIGVAADRTFDTLAIGELTFRRTVPGSPRIARPRDRGPEPVRRAPGMYVAGHALARRLKPS